MKNKLIKATLIVSVLSVLTRALSFVFRIYLSHTLGAEKLGIYQIALSVFFLFATICAGLPLVTSRKTAECTALGTDNDKSTISASLVIGLTLSGLIVSVFCLFPNLFSPLFSDERCIPVFYVLLPSCISTATCGILRGWFWGKRNYTVFALTEFLECTSRIALGFLLISGITGTVSGLTGTALSFTISDYLCTLLIFILFLILGGRLKKPVGYTSIIKSSLPLTAVRVYNSLINSLIAIIVPIMLTKSGIDNSIAVADFGRAMGMAIPLLLAPSTLTGSIATVLVPELATLKARQNDGALRNKIENSLSVVVLCSSLFIGIFIPLGKEIGLLLYNDVDAGVYVSIASFIILPMGINGISSTILDSLGLEMKTMRNYIVGSIFTLFSLIVLPRFIQTYAIAVGLGLNYTVTGILNCLVLKKKSSLALKKLFKTILCEGVTVGVCAYGGVFIKNLLSATPLIVQIIIPCLFIVIFYAVVNSLYGYIDFSAFYKKKKNYTPKENSLLL